MDAIDLLNPNPPLAHRFGVFFFPNGTGYNPIDFRFQRVSGISTELTTHTVNEGGQNLFSHRLPDKVSYGNLVLERGYAIVSPLVQQFDDAFSFFKFAPSNVMVTLLGEYGIPMGAWLYEKAYPVGWKMSDLNAQANEIVIDTMELAYQRFQVIRI